MNKDKSPWGKSKAPEKQVPKIEKPKPKICSENDCGRKVCAKDLCKRHYNVMSDIAKGVIPAKKGTKYEIFLQYIKVAGDCWLWQGVYTKDKMCKFTYKKVGVTAQRFSYSAHNDVDLDRNYRIVSQCGNRKCVNPHHLEKVKHIGTTGKLSDEKALAIYKDILAGELSQTKIALKHSTSRTTVRSIETGERYTDVTGHKKND